MNKALDSIYAPCDLSLLFGHELRTRQVKGVGAVNPLFWLDDAGARRGDRPAFFGQCCRSWFWILLNFAGTTSFGLVSRRHQNLGFQLDDLPIYVKTRGVFENFVGLFGSDLLRLYRCSRIVAHRVILAAADRLLENLRRRYSLFC